MKRAKMKRVQKQRCHRLAQSERMELKRVREIPTSGPLPGLGAFFMHALPCVALNNANLIASNSISP